MTLENRYRDYNKERRKDFTASPRYCPGVLGNFMFSSCLDGLKRIDSQECDFRLGHIASDICFFALFVTASSSKYEFFFNGGYHVILSVLVRRI